MVKKVILILLCLFLPSKLLYAQQLKTQELLYAADEIIYDTEGDIVRALGNVDIVTPEYEVHADELVYYRKSGRIEAYGNIVSLDKKTGEEMRGHYLNLSDSFERSRLDSFWLLLTNEARIAAASGFTEPDGRIEAQKAIYSACPVCEEDPQKPLLWQIRAGKVKLNPVNNMVTYRNVWFDIAGIPLFFTPFFAQADPRLGRQSGWLAPTISWNQVFGTTTELPYYIAVSKDSDMTLSPLIHGTNAFTGKLEYRKALRNGNYQIEAAGTLVRKTDEDFPDFLNGEAEHLSGYARAHADFDLSRHWRTRMDWTESSHEDYLRDVFNDERDVIRNDVVIEGFHEQHYHKAELNRYASGTSAQAHETLPLAIQMFSALDFKVPLSKMDFSLETHLRGITRSGAPTGSLRASISPGFYWHGGEDSFLDWSLLTQAYGQFYNDSYDRNGLETEEELARVIPYFSADIRAPFYNTSAYSKQTLTPRLSFTGSLLEDEHKNRVINEDSQEMVMTLSNTYNPNRWSGQDLIDTGLRLNYGVDWDMFGRKEGRASFGVAQSFHLLGDNAADADDPDKRFSNVIAAVHFSPNNHLSFDYQTSFGFESDRLDRHDLRARIGANWGSFSTNYLSLDGGEDQRLIVDNHVNFTDEWSSKNSIRYDLDAAEVDSLGFSVHYDHRCAKLALKFDHNFIEGQQDEYTVTFSVVLATLGENITSASF